MLNKFLVVMCYGIMGVNMYNCNIFNKNVDLYNLEYRKQHHYFSLLTQVNLYVISVHRYCYISVLISLHKHVFSLISILNYFTALFLSYRCWPKTDILHHINVKPYSFLFCNISLDIIPFTHHNSLSILTNNLSGVLVHCTHLDLLLYLYFMNSLLSLLLHA